jgi:hypothetical protein
MCFTSDARNDYIESKAETPRNRGRYWDDRSLLQQRVITSQVSSRCSNSVKRCMSKVTHMERSVDVRFRTLRILIAVRPHTERVRIARPEESSRRIVQRQQRQSRLPAATKLSRSDMDVVVVLEGIRNDEPEQLSSRASLTRSFPEPSSSHSQRRRRPRCPPTRSG